MSRCTYLNCRQEVHNAGVFCGRCGRRVETPAPPAASTSPAPVLAWIVPAAVIATIVLGMLFFVTSTRVMTVSAPAALQTTTFQPVTMARNPSMPSSVRLGPELAKDWRLIDVTLDAPPGRIDPLSYDGGLVVHLQRLVGRGVWQHANRAELRAVRVTGEAANGSSAPMLSRFADEGGSFDRSLLRIHPARLLDLRQPTVIEYDDASHDETDERYLRR